MHRLAMMMAMLVAGQASADPVLDAYLATSVGGFSTAAQHAADPRYDLAEANIASIWRDATDGVWVYHEQALVDRPGLTAAAARATP